MKRRLLTNKMVPPLLLELALVKFQLPEAFCAAQRISRKDRELIYSESNSPQKMTGRSELINSLSVSPLWVEELFVLYHL